MLESPKTPSSHLSFILPPFSFSLNSTVLHLFLSLPRYHSLLPPHISAPNCLHLQQPRVLFRIFISTSLFTYFSFAFLSRECSSSSPIILHHRSISFPQVSIEFNPLFLVLLRVFVIFRCVHLWRKLRRSSRHAHSSSPLTLVHQLVSELRFRPCFTRQR
ncbi:hypothetical protein LR48_Vigan07g208000 [Vigna angularis]|uniref:Transmembrane protein n=1 Tax=Phaseolus angularis TaxID=3914 RepID=A0A0L9V089_PHAAN|nr:hypothetical protein LR48_Vigan07g208000 [Vigna angularis]